MKPDFVNLERMPRECRFSLPDVENGSIAFVHVHSHSLPVGILDHVPCVLAKKFEERFENPIARGRSLTVIET
jgi:hypothetical protein